MKRKLEYFSFLIYRDPSAPVDDRLAKTRFTDFCRLKKIDANIDIKQSGPPHDPLFSARYKKLLFYLLALT